MTGANKKWCECNPRCMVRNPRQPVTHGKRYTYEGRHNCRCDKCVEAYREALIESELRNIDTLLELV